MTRAIHSSVTAILLVLFGSSAAGDSSRPSPSPAKHEEQAVGAVCAASNGVSYSPENIFHSDHPCYSTSACPAEGGVCANHALIKLVDYNAEDYEDLLVSPHRGVWGSTFASADPDFTSAPAENGPDSLGLSDSFSTTYPTTLEGKSYEELLRARNVEMDITTFGNNAEGEPGTPILSHYLTTRSTVNGSINEYLVDMTAADIASYPNYVIKRDFTASGTQYRDLTFDKIVPEHVIDPDDPDKGLIVFLDIKARRGAVQCQTEYITATSDPTAYAKYNCQYSDSSAKDPDDPSMTVAQRTKANTDIAAAQAIAANGAQKNIIIKTALTYDQVVKSFEVFNAKYKPAGAADDKLTNYLWQVHPTSNLSVQQAVQYMHDWLVNAPKSVSTWELLVYSEASTTVTRFCVTAYDPTATTNYPYGQISVAVEGAEGFPVDCTHGPYQNIYDYVRRETGNPDYFGFTDAQKDQNLISGNRAQMWALETMSAAGTADRDTRWQYLGSDHTYQLSDVVKKLNFPYTAYQMLTADRIETVRQVMDTGAYGKSAPGNLACYLFIGQSNMAGRADFDIENHPEDFDVVPRSWLFNGVSFEQAQNIMTTQNGEPYPLGLNRYSSVQGTSQQKLSPAFFFAKALATASEQQTDIGLIVNARGATYLDQWSEYAQAADIPDSWNIDDTLYDLTSQQVAAALSTDNCAGDQLAGIFMLIGESDTLSASLSTAEAAEQCPTVEDCDLPWSAGEYVAALGSFVEQIRKLDGAAEAPFFAIQIPFTDPCYFQDLQNPSPPCEPISGYVVPPYQYGQPERGYAYNAALYQLAENVYEDDSRKDNGIYIVRSAGLPTIGAPAPNAGGNRVHFNREGDEQLGQRMADAVVAHVLGAEPNANHAFHYEHDCYAADPTTSPCSELLAIMNPSWGAVHRNQLSIVPGRGLWGFGAYADNAENSYSALQAALRAYSQAALTFTNLGDDSDFYPEAMASADFIPERTTGVTGADATKPYVQWAPYLIWDLRLRARDGTVTGNRPLDAEQVLYIARHAGPLIVELVPYDTGSSSSSELAEKWVELFTRFFDLPLDTDRYVEHLAIKTPYSPLFIKYHLPNPDMFHYVTWIPQVQQNSYYADNAAPGMAPSAASSSMDFINLWQAEQASVIAFETNYGESEDSRLQPVTLWDEDTTGSVSTTYSNLLQFLRFTLQRRAGVYAPEPIGRRGSPSPWDQWTMKNTQEDMRADPIFVTNPDIKCAGFLLVTSERPDAWDSMRSALGAMTNNCNVLDYRRRHDKQRSEGE